MQALAPGRWRPSVPLDPTSTDWHHVSRFLGIRLRLSRISEAGGSRRKCPRSSECLGTPLSDNANQGPDIRIRPEVIRTSMLWPTGPQQWPTSGIDRAASLTRYPLVFVLGASGSPVNRQLAGPIALISFAAKHVEFLTIEFEQGQRVRCWQWGKNRHSLTHSQGKNCK